MKALRLTDQKDISPLFVILYVITFLLILSFLLFLLNAHNFYYLVIFYFIFHQLSWFIFLVNDLTVVSWDIIVYVVINLIFTYFIVAIQLIFYFFLRRTTVITVIAKDRSWLHRVVLSFFYLLVFFVFFHQYAFFKLL